MNIFTVAVGPSGLAYKSTPMNYFVVPTLLAVGERVGKPLLMPSRFSVEGMIEYLSKKNNKGEYVNNEGCIVRDEFTSVFKEAYKKDYLMDALEFLSELYDGTVVRRYTRKTQLEEYRKVYVNLIAATTPYLYTVMRREFFVQGTGNRILFVIHKPDSVPKVDGEVFFMSGYELEERIKIIERFSECLANLYNSRLRYVYPDPEAGKMWAEYKAEKSRESLEMFRKDPKNLEYSYVERAPEFALKLSALAAISRGYEAIPLMRSADTYLVNKNDMSYAINRVEKHLKYFRTLLEDWGSVTYEAPVRTYDSNLNYLYSFFEKQPDGVLTQRELLEMSGMVLGVEFSNLMVTLMKVGKVKVLSPKEVEVLDRKTKERHGIKDDDIVYRRVG